MGRTTVRAGQTDGGRPAVDQCLRSAAVFADRSVRLNSIVELREPVAERACSLEDQPGFERDAALQRQSVAKQHRHERNDDRIEQLRLDELPDDRAAIHVDVATTAQPRKRVAGGTGEESLAVKRGRRAVREHQHAPLAVRPAQAVTRIAVTKS